jgi:agmatinase
MPDPYLGAGLVFLGVSYDGGTSQAPGARYGPYHVRRSSVYAIKWDYLGNLPCRAVDGGNVVCPAYAPAEMRERVEAEVHKIAASAVPFLVGGDHSVSLPAMRALAKKHGPLAVVHVDAHTDTVGKSELMGPDEYHHASPMRHALKEGLIERGQLYQLGIRAGVDPEITAEYDVHVSSADDLLEARIPTLVSEIRARIGARPTYVSFDIDAVDPAFAPGTGTPCPGGLSSREALRLVRCLAGVRLVGMDVVEVLPALDHHDCTGLLAAAVLMEGVGVFVASAARK